MVEMIEITTRDSRSKGAGNLLQSLAEAAIGDKSQALSREEVIGNMFVYNFAGHDTTSHSFVHTFHLLATHPKVQDWMAEEIAHVSKDVPSGTLEYEHYPRFVRTLAVFVSSPFFGIYMSH